MTESEIRHLAASLLIVGFRGLTAEAGTVIYEQVHDSHLGGVVLFSEDLATNERGRNIVGPEQLTELCEQLRAAADRLLIVAIDQEGGAVTRLDSSNGFEDFPAAARLAEDATPAETRIVSERMAKALRKVGINMNFAPVVDLNIRPDNPIIGALGRSFAADADTVVAHARAFVQGHHENGVACVLKHFPGHGSSAADSHVQRVDVSDSYLGQELQPYRELAAEADAIMVGHVINRAFDPELPASLSRAVITGLLRDDIGYGGVVVTDCLQMVAAADSYSLRERVSLALTAGADLLLFGNNLSYDENLPAKVLDAVVAAVRGGDLTTECLQEHADRVDHLRWSMAHRQVEHPLDDGA